MARETALQIRGFQGLNIRDNPGIIEDTELTVATNVNVGVAGELSKRTGLERLHAGATLGNNAVKILGHFLTDTYSQLIVKAGDTVYYSTDGAAFTSIGTYSDAEWGVQYADEFYIIRSGNIMVKWTGAAASTITGSPSGTFAIIHKERMYVVNTVAAGTLSSRLYFSSAGDVSATGWPGTNFFDVQPGDGDFLVSLVVLQDLLVIFKGKSTWALYIQGSTTDWIVRSLNAELGCISKYGTKIIEGYLYLSSTRGVYRTDGTIFTNISQKISTVFLNRIVNTTTVNVDSFGTWGDQMICLISTSAAVKVYYVYNYRTETWTKWEFAGGIAPQTFTEVYANTPGAGLYCGGSNANGSVYRYGSSVYTDAGSTYPVTVTTKEMDIGIPTDMKRGKWTAIDVIGAATVSWTHTADYVNTTNGTVSSTATRSLAKFPGPGFFRVWKLSISVTSSAELTILGVILHTTGQRSVIGANT